MDTIFLLFPLISIALIGFLIGRRKLFDDNFSSQINKFLFFVALPIFLLGSFDGISLTYAKDFLPFIFINTLIICAFYFAIYLVAKILKVKKESTAAILTPSLSGNTFYFGFPILLSVFAQEHISYAIIYMNFVLLSDYLGIFMITRLMGEKFSLRKQLSDFIKTPIVLATLIALLLMLLQISLPDKILEITDFFGKTISTMALFSLGLYFAKGVNLADIKSPLIVATIKLMLFPLVTYVVVYHIIPLPEVAAQTSVILTCMPSAIYNIILADTYKTKKEITATSILLTSLLFIITSIFWINLVK